MNLIDKEAIRSNIIDPKTLGWTIALTPALTLLPSPVVDSLSPKTCVRATKNNIIPTTKTGQYTRGSSTALTNLSLLTPINKKAVSINTSITIMTTNHGLTKLMNLTASAENKNKTPIQNEMNSFTNLFFPNNSNLSSAAKTIANTKPKENIGIKKFKVVKSNTLAIFYLGGSPNHDFLILSQSLLLLLLPPITEKIIIKIMTNTNNVGQ